MFGIVGDRTPRFLWAIEGGNIRWNQSRARVCVYRAVLKFKKKKKKKKKTTDGSETEAPRITD